jgi:hypothetical protein
MWKNASQISPIPIDININPSWLNVDRAITFFKSISLRAIMPAYSLVRSPRRKRASLIEGPMEVLNRKVRNTPAVTRVDECTNAETGVGADMAAGSHEEKGN